MKRRGLNVTGGRDAGRARARSQEGVSGEVLQAISAQLLLLHSPVLEPDLHLAVGEVQHSRELQPLLLVNVNIEEEFPLQLADLELGVWTPLLPGAGCAWTRPNTRGLLRANQSLSIQTAHAQMGGNIWKI